MEYNYVVWELGATLLTAQSRLLSKHWRIQYGRQKVRESQRGKLVTIITQPVHKRCMQKSGTIISRLAINCLVEIERESFTPTLPGHPLTQDTGHTLMQ